MTMQDPTKRRALGRGLDALLPSGATPQPAAPRETTSARIEELHPTDGQPRRIFDDARLEELAQSIRELGVLEPILVRKRSTGGFHIIAGERRWRAAQRAGLHDVPVFVKELSDAEAFEAALVENLQREDLNPIETARAFQRLIDEHGHTQETVAQRLGKDRSTVSNSLRLLKLPEGVLEMVEQSQLSEGHGRALLVAGDPHTMLKLARSAIEKSWSVRETEKAARFAADIAKAKEKGKEAPEKGKSPNTRDLETRLSRSLGAKVNVADRNGKGNLQIQFTSYDELDRLLERLLT
jgi:ParB family transcriptional regulator, chromosome partitioning protein